MRRALALLPALVLAACATAEVGTKARAELLDKDQTIGGFADLDGIRPWDGTIVKLGAFGSERPGEWVSLDVWPVLGFGAGPIGARLQILPLEFGGGFGYYTPVQVAEAIKAAQAWQSRYDVRLAMTDHWRGS